MGQVVDVFLPLAVSFVMLSIGLGLSTSDFLRVAAYPRDFLLGLFSQLLVLPTVAFFMAVAFAASPELAVGLVLIAAAPGGATSNLLTLMAEGDVALSVTLTAITSLFSAITIPPIVYLCHQFFFQQPPTGSAFLGAISVRLFLIASAPVLLGVLLRRYRPEFTKRVEPGMRKTSLLVFVLVLLTAIAQEWDDLPAYFAQAGFLTLALLFAMLAITYFGLARFASGERQRRAITIECGIQGGIVAIAVATAVYGGGVFVIPAITYSLTMYFVVLAMIAVLRRRREPAA